MQEGHLNAKLLPTLRAKANEAPLHQWPHKAMPSASTVITVTTVPGYVIFPQSGKMAAHGAALH